MVRSGDIKILIVDDEAEVRQLLSIMLKSARDINICGEASSVDDAIKLLDKCKPDIILLDVQMPDKDGFEFVKELRELGMHPAIIFISAHEDYAIRAIKNAAFDYVTKPIDKEELFFAISRYRDSKNRDFEKELHALSTILKQNKLDRIRLNTRTGYFFVNPKEIVYIKADGNYSHIMLPNNNVEIITQSLGSMEESLESGLFFRASRSYIINMQYISRVDRKKSTVNLECYGNEYSIKIPAGRIKALESYF